MFNVYQYHVESLVVYVFYIGDISDMIDSFVNTPLLIYHNKSYVTHTIKGNIIQQVTTERIIGNIIYHNYATNHNNR